MKAAVVGLGWWGKQIITYLKTSEKIRVTHGVDLNIAHLDDFAKENHLVLVSKIDEVLKNPA